MVSAEIFTQIAMSLPEVSEQPHFEKTSFRVCKKIFATLNTKDNRACIKLTEIDQDVFSKYGTSVFFPVPNKWGKQGWTLIDLEKAEDEILTDAVRTAYRNAANAKLISILDLNDTRYLPIE